MAEVKDLIVYGSSNLIGEAFADIINANSFKTNGGTSSQFVKGDGSLDNSEYITDVTVGGTSVVSNGVAAVPSIPDSTSDLINDSGFITSADVPSPADTSPLMDGTAAVGTSTDYAREDHVHPSDTSKVDKVSSSTDNAIVRFDGTGSAIQNSGITIDDNNYMNVPGRVVIQGSNTSNTTRFITSDASNNIYASVGGVTSLVITNNEVRRGGSATSVNLGTSSYPWNNAYAKKFITDGGTSSQLVRGDGTLATISTTDQYEAYLLWGGKNFYSSYGPLDASMVPELGSNRTQFLKPQYVSVEYSRDAGETWLDYEATDAQKGNLFSVLALSGLRLGKATTKGEMTSSYMLRVTITDTLAANLYTTLRKFVIYDTTEGSTGCYCTIQGRTAANVSSDTDTWVTFRDSIDLGGWSGYNVINYPTGFTTYGNQNSQYRQIRFIFGCTSGPSSSYYGFQLGKIMCFGGDGWSNPSNMAKQGHIYNWDYQQNAIFPARVTAPILKASSTLAVGYSESTGPMFYDEREMVNDLGTTYSVSNGYIDYTGTWVSSTTYKHYAVPVTGVRKVTITASENNGSFYTFVKNYTTGNPPSSSYAMGYTSRIQITRGQVVEAIVPSDAEMLILYVGSVSANPAQPYKPDSLKFSGAFSTRTDDTEEYFNYDAITANGAIVANWRDHDVTNLILESIIRTGYIGIDTLKYTTSSTNYSSYVLLLDSIKSIKVTAGSADTRVMFLSKEGVTNNVVAPVVPISEGVNSIGITAGNEQTIDVPQGARYLYILLGTLSNSEYSRMPASLKFTGIRGAENFPLTINSTTYDGSAPASITGLAIDSNVVHKTGNLSESINGEKTFTSDLHIDGTSSLIVEEQSDILFNTESGSSAHQISILNSAASPDGGDGIGVLEMVDMDISDNVILRGISDPINNNDAANKHYVDTHGGGGSYAGNSYVFYGTCSTADSTVAKEVVCPDFTSSDLVEGVMVIVKFSVKNTGAVANLTLNVNETGAKGIRKIYTDSGVTTLTNAAELAANATIPFIYNGTYWVVAGLDYNINTNTIGYQLRTNSSTRKTTDGFRYYKILFTSADGTHWVPASATKTNNASTAIAVNQRPINPFGEIVYFSYTTNYSAESTVSGSYTWQQYPFVLGYSFNRTGAALELTTQTPVYIKCAPQADGSAIIDADTPYVQSLPSTDDGKIYIFLGIAYDATHVELTMKHPVYQYKNGAVRLWGQVPDVPSEYLPTQYDYLYLSGSRSWINLEDSVNGICYGNYLPISGGQMTPNSNIIGLSETPPTSSTASYRTYAASWGMIIDNFLKLDGTSSMEGSLNMESSGVRNKIINLEDPVDPSDAATKKYVDSIAGNNWLRSDSSVENLQGGYGVQSAWASSSGTNLGWITPMEPNTTCHIFVYGGTTVNSFSAGKVIIPSNKTPYGTASNNDTIIINNKVYYKNGNKIIATSPSFTINADEILEINVMYVEINVGSSIYHRTIYKTAQA